MTIAQVTDQKRKKRLIGKFVYIKGEPSRENMWGQEWGIVKGVDGDRFEVAIWNGDTIPVFDRYELRVPNMYYNQNTKRRVKNI